MTSSINKTKVLMVFGTRPEAIKMCPLAIELKSRKEIFDLTVCVTGQHKEMLQSVLEAFDVHPDIDLSIMKRGQTLFDITCEVLKRTGSVIEEYNPDVVLVHGDTTTSYAAALAAFYLHIPIGHVEAGLRTYNLESPFPEEFNRQSVDIISDYLFAPTERAKENLINEGKSKANIFVTGNTGIDALRTTVRPGYTDENLRWAEGSRLVLVTAHRRENLGTPMRDMFRAIRSIADKYQDVKVIYPVHMNPAVREVANEELSGSDRIRLIEPLDVLDFHNYLDRAYMVLTDSGGIQEEAPSLGKPVLVMRDTTERPEGVEAGTLKLVGTSRERIFNEAARLLDDSKEYERMSAASNPYGDGYASRRIADILSSGR